MKKFVIFAVVSSALSIASSGCGDGGRAERERQDSIRRADSLAFVIKEQARLDSIRRDSLMEIEIDLQFDKPLTLKPGEMRTRQVGDNQCEEINWELYITNNTDLPLFPEDYIITYTGDDETMGEDGGLIGVSRDQTMEGPELAPKSTVTTTLFVPYGKFFGISTPKVQLTLSKEEFSKRYKEALKESKE